MENQRIKIQCRSARSIKVSVPFDGIVSLDAEGTVEVSSRCADALLINGKDWKVYGANEAVTPAVEGKELPETGGSEGGDVAPAPTDRERFIAHVGNLTVKELQAMAVSGELPEAEWKKLNKADLTAYLIEQYDARIAEEEAEEPEEPIEEPEEDPEGAEEPEEEPEEPEEPEEEPEEPEGE